VGELQGAWPLPLAAGALAVVHAVAYDPYYAPLSRRYAEGTSAVPWLTVVAAVAVLAALARSPSAARRAEARSPSRHRSGSTSRRC
jgi:hypothetical protein